LFSETFSTENLAMNKKLLRTSVALKK